MIERIKSLLIKEFRQIFRDPRMKIVIFISPLLQILIFGYAANNDITSVRMGIFDLNKTPETRDIIRKFTDSTYFVPQLYISNPQEMREALDSSTVDLVLEINPRFSQDFIAGSGAQVLGIVDGTDSNTASLILSYANSILFDYDYDLLEQRLENALKKPGVSSIDLRSRVWFNENLKSRNYYLPGVIALIVTLITLLLTAMAIVREKEIGTMEQLMVSPIKPYELILGKLFPFAVIGMIDVVFITSVALFWFGIPFRGNMLVLFCGTLVYILNSLGVGLFISTLSATQQEALMSTFLFFMPANLLSGFIFPIQNMPSLIQYITYVNPMRYYLVILRGVFLKGSGFDVLWTQFAALLILGTCLVIMSSLRFHKRIG